MPSAKVAGAAIWLLAILMSPPSLSQTPIQNVQNALSQVTKTAEEVTSQVQQASSQAQAKVNELPQAPIESKPQLDVVSEGERTHLCGKISAFTGHAQSQELEYSSLALATIISAAGLALVGSISSFLAKNKTAESSASLSRPL